MGTKGHCKHGEFDLREGCPLCIADREGREGNTETSIAEAIEAVNQDEELAPETTLALRPGEDIEVHGYFEEALKLLEYAESRVITTVEDVKLATDDLSVISKLKKAMLEKRKSLLELLKAQSDAIRDTYNYLMAPVLEADKITRDKMLDFDMEQRRIQQEQEEINRKRQEAAEAEMRLKGELTESVNLVEVTKAPETVRTDMGLSTTTDRWKYRVDNPDLLPREYMIPDDAMLSVIAKKHHDKKPVPGVTFYNDPFITVRTN